MAVASASALLVSCNKKKVDLEELSGSELLIGIHEKLLEDHKTYIKYGAYQSYVYGSNANPSIDQHNEKDTKIVGFYTGKLQATYSGFTREHVWACANSNGLWTHTKTDGVHYVDGSDYKGGGSDLFHVRPCTNQINEDRGNAKLYVFKTTDPYYEHSDGGPYVIKTDTEGTFASKFEPADEQKGDMARILMYVYAHYASIGDNSEVSDTVRNYLGALNLRDVFNSSYSLKEVQDLLVEWNEMDPPDDTEKMRNDTVEKIQGNRNIFVDHPEYIKKIFQEDLEE